MENWKIVLLDQIFGFWKSGKKDGYYCVTVQPVSALKMDSVLYALHQGLDDQTLSTDFKQMFFDLEENKIFVEVGSKQAQDEFADRLSILRSTVSDWRKSQENLKQHNNDNSQSVVPEKKGIDPETILLAICLIAVLLLVLTD